MQSFHLFVLMIWLSVPALAKTIDVTLPEALAQELLQAEFISLGGHAGQTLQLDVANPTKHEVNLAIPAGMILASNNPDEQDLLIVRSQQVTLEKEGKRRVKLYVVCTQSSKSSPTKDAGYTYHGMADDSLIRLTAFIDKKAYYNREGIQSAVWTLINNEELSSIYDTEEQVMNDLVSEMMAITGKTKPWYNTQYNSMEPGPRIEEVRTPHTLHANYQFTFDESAVITIQLFNEDGEVLSTIAEDVAIRPGQLSMRYKLVVNNMPKATYYVRVFNRDQQLDERVVEL